MVLATIMGSSSEMRCLGLINFQKGIRANLCFISFQNGMGLLKPMVINWYLDNMLQTDYSEILWGISMFCVK